MEIISSIMRSVQSRFHREIVSGVRINKTIDTELKMSNNNQKAYIGNTAIITINENRHRMCLMGGMNGLQRLNTPPGAEAVQKDMKEI